MALNIIMGCNRLSNAVNSPASTTTNTFVPGQFLQLNASAELVIVSDNTKALGLSFEEKDATLNEVQGSTKATVVMGVGIVESDQIASGITFAVGDIVYSDSSGNLSNVASGRKMGVSLALKDSSNFLRFYLQPTL